MVRKEGRRLVEIYYKLDLRVNLNVCKIKWVKERSRTTIRLPKALKFYETKATLSIFDIQCPKFSKV